MEAFSCALASVSNLFAQPAYINSQVIIFITILVKIINFDSLNWRVMLVLNVVVVILIIILLKSLQLLSSVVTHKLFDAHVSATNSNQELSVYNFGKHLARPKSIIPVSKSLNWDRELHIVYVVSKYLIDKITFYSSVLLFRFLDSLNACLNLMIFLLVSFHSLTYFLQMIQNVLYILFNKSVIC